MSQIGMNLGLRTEVDSNAVASHRRILEAVMTPDSQVWVDSNSRAGLSDADLIPSFRAEMDSNSPRSILSRFVASL